MSVASAAFSEGYMSDSLAQNLRKSPGPISRAEK